MSIQTQVYEPEGIKNNRNGLQMVIILTIAGLISALNCVLQSGITFANLLYEFTNYLYLCEMALVMAFCYINIRSESRFVKSSLIMTGIASILLSINMVQFMIGYGDELDTDRFYLNLLVQYDIFRVIFFLGVGLLFFSLTKVAVLSGRQKVFRWGGIIWTFSYMAWICFFRFPYDAATNFSLALEGVMQSYVQVCSDIYQSFTWLLTNRLNLNAISLTSDIIYIIISVMFIKTRPITVKREL